MQIFLVVVDVVIRFSSVQRFFRESAVSFPPGSGAEARPSTHFCGTGIPGNAYGDTNFWLYGENMTAVLANA